MKIFPSLTTGAFISRPNHFIVECHVNGRRVRAYLPNPGRLMELLLPGSTLYLTSGGRRRDKKTRYTVAGVDREGTPVMLHTHLSNAVVMDLIDHERIRGLEGARVIKSEFPLGNSRFDFFLERKGRKEGPG